MLIVKYRSKPVSQFERLFFGIVFTLTMLPNLNFLPFLSGVNNQPVAALLVLSYFTLLGLKFWNTPFRLYSITLPLILVTYLILALILGLSSNPYPAPGFYTYPTGDFRTFLYTFAYLVGPLLMIYFYKKNELITYRLLHFTLGFQLFLVLVQYSGINSLQMGLALILDPLFIGYNSSSLTGLGRGAAGSFAEPSHLGRYAVLYLVLSLFMFRKSNTGRAHKFFLIATSLSLLVASQAITAIAILIIFGGVIFLKALLFLKISRLLKLLVLSVLLIIGIFSAQPGSRIADSGEKLQQLTDIGQDFTVLDLQAFGGIRLINTVIGLRSISLYPFGQGIGSAPHTMLDTSYQLGIPLLETDLYKRILSGKTDSKGSVKPQGIGAQYIYDFGIFGLLCIFLLSIPVLRSAFKNHNVDILATAPFVGLILVLFYTTTTFPMPWLLMSLISVPVKRF